MNVIHVSIFITFICSLNAKYFPEVLSSYKNFLLLAEKCSNKLAFNCLNINIIEGMANVINPLATQQMLTYLRLDIQKILLSKTDHTTMTILMHKSDFKTWKLNVFANIKKMLHRRVWFLYIMDIYSPVIHGFIWLLNFTIHHLLTKHLPTTNKSCWPWCSTYQIFIQYICTCWYCIVTLCNNGTIIESGPYEHTTFQ